MIDSTAVLSVETRLRLTLQDGDALRSWLYPTASLAKDFYDKAPTLVHVYAIAPPTAPAAAGVWVQDVKTSGGPTTLSALQRDIADQFGITLRDAATLAAEDLSTATAAAARDAVARQAGAVASQDSVLAKLVTVFRELRAVVIIAGVAITLFVLWPWVATLWRRRGS